jgi:hypothetical protein
MSETLKLIVKLVGLGEVRISDHAYDELTADDIFARDVIAGVSQAVVVEDYPQHGRGPCVLVRQLDRDAKAIHALWGIPRGLLTPAVSVTGYRPDPQRWNDDFLKRRKQ